MEWYPHAQPLHEVLQVAINPLYDRDGFHFTITKDEVKRFYFFDRYGVQRNPSMRLPQAYGSLIDQFRAGLDTMRRPGPYKDLPPEPSVPLEARVQHVSEVLSEPDAPSPTPLSLTSLLKSDARQVSLSTGLSSPL